MNRQTLRLLPLAIAGTLALAACGNTSTAEAPAAAAGELQVVTSTTVYADLVQQIGGDQVKVTPIIDSAAKDPHSYEATSRDKLTMSKAQLVVANGGGYDEFMNVLATDLKIDDSTLINAVDTSPVALVEEEEEEGHDHAEDSAASESAETGGEADPHAGHNHAAYNEHVWYDVESMQLLSNEITKHLSELKPEAAATFEANAAELTQKLKGLSTELTSLGKKLDGKHFAMTEPVPFHLLEDLGMSDATPEGLSESIEGDGEISPQAFNQMGTLLTGGDIDVLAYNTQTQSPQTERIREQATSAKVPVVDFTETLPDNTDYVTWMESNIHALEVLAK